MLKKRIISFMTALSMTLMIFTSMPISVLALPITDNCTGNHSGMTAWNATEHLPTTGMYYLNKDVTISSQTTINSGDDLTLCLNGHTVNAEENSRIFYIKGGSLTLCDCQNNPGKLTDGSTKVSSNSAEKDGGAVYLDGGSFTMYGGTIYNNTAAGDITDNSRRGVGGGIYVNSGTFTMNGGVISNNKSSRSDGGGVFVNGGTFIMNGGTISENKASDGGGGGVYVESGGTFTMNSGSKISNNEAYSGGGLYVYGSTFTMNGGAISQNKAKSAGGGIDAGFTPRYFGTAKLTINDGLISDNQTTNSNGSGGGIYTFGKVSAALNGGTISGNTSQNGGGVYVSYAAGNGSVTLNGNVGITGNTKTDSTSNNVQISSGNILTVGSNFSTNTPIGVSVSNSPTSCANPVAVTNSVSEAVYEKFTSEMDGDGSFSLGFTDGVIQFEMPHDYDTEAWTSDDSSHWHKCKTTDCTAKKDEAAHTWNNGACTVCGEAEPDTGIEINEENFPDENFRKYVSDNCDTDKNGSLSDDEIAAVKEIYVYTKNISDMTGIEYFTELKNLYCGNNNLTALDVSQNTALTTLNCSNNQLTALDVSQNTALTTLDCSNNQLTALDVSQNTALTTLDCNNNQLTALDVSQNTALTTLECYRNQLTSLDVSQNTALTTLRCYKNQLTSLDVSQNTALTFLDCNNNQLVALDISKNTNLTNVFCEGNKYTVSGCMVDPADLPGSFDLSKASNWTNAKIENGKIISDGTGTATYTYNCGNGKSETFSIQFGQHNYVDGTCTVCGEAEPNAGIAINEENFPDENFRKYVSDNCDADKNGSLSDDEIAAVTTIDVNTKSIWDMKGIEYFTALESLDCSTNNFTTLNVSQNTALTTLKCSVNQLTALDVSQNPALESLDCFNNNLTSLNVRSNHALTTLTCDFNQLTALDVSQNTALTTLECGGNQLTALDVSQNTALTTLECCRNQLTSLSVGKNTALTTLKCYKNQLTSLDVSQNTALTSLNCNDNQLTSLDVSQNTALTSLQCYNNQIVVQTCVFDPAAITSGFELSKTSNWTNAEITNDNKIFYLGTGNVTYTYDCGNSRSAIFTLVFPSRSLTKVDKKDATCTEDGNIEYYECSCGCKFKNENPAAADILSDEDVVTAATGHTFSDKWTSSDTHHWHAATCGHTDEVEGKAVHDWGDGIVTTEPTEESDGVKTYTCTVCSATRTESIGKAEHQHTLTAHDAVPADCTTDGNEAYWTCSGCNKIFSDENGTTEITAIPTISATGHKFSTEWTSDSMSHWHTATCGHDVISEAAAHTEDNGTVTVPATAENDGLKTYACSVCGYVMRTVTIPKLGEDHTHSFSLDWKHDSTSHWHECDCGEKTDIAPHIENSGVVTTEPTEASTGIMTYSCETCGYVTRTDVIPALIPEHSHTFGTDWKYDIVSHWHECDCGEKTGIAPHIENGGVTTVQPTETTAGEMTYRCTVCGTVTRTVTIPPTGEVHTHVFGTEWKYSDTRHWHECVCGEKADEALHTPGSGTVTKQPTAYETGVRTYYCTVCGGFIFSETIPATGTVPAPVIPYFPSERYESKEPYLQNDSSKKGWNVISDDILSTPDGETVNVKMNGTTELPQNIVSDIAGRDIDLVLDMGSYSWAVNGMSVTNAKSVDMSVRKVDKIPESTVQEFFGDSKTVQLDLRHNGDFGFIAELTVDVGKRYSGKYANSYCYKSRTFEFGDSGEIVNGKAKLRFAHASSWLITIDDYPVVEDVSSGAAAHSAGTPIDMSNSTSGVTLPEFDEKKKLRLSNTKRRYRILKKRKLDDLVFVL